MTPSMLSILKEQIPSEDQYNRMVEKIARYQMYYSLYIDTKTNESVFVLDSLAKEEGVSIAGYIDYVYTEPSGKFIGAENFMGEQVWLSVRAISFFPSSSLKFLPRSRPKNLTESPMNIEINPMTNY